jgi:hypothetical protein
MELLMNKYHLKDLHKEIDYFDRKVAYCKTHENFESDAARALALGKLLTKRESLVKVAVELARRGIECDPKYLPRSFKNPVESTPAKKSAA